MISIIIRTKNEERWINHCLKMVFAQEYKDFEVIIIDNDSIDGTLMQVQRHPVAEIITLLDFKPGAAINAGIQKAKGEYIVCLSAHCVPKDDQWLLHLLKNFTSPDVAGVYGRQLPVSFSAPSDKRDLLITFGLDRRVQIKDYFFHNANSMLRKDIWEKIPFDQNTPNIEDRLWGKSVIECGFRLVYEPDAAVFHYHGIHQGNNPERAKSVAYVIERFEKGVTSAVPNSWKAENCNAVAILPILGSAIEIDGHALLVDLLNQIKKSRYVKSIYILSESEQIQSMAAQHNVHFLKRPDWLMSKEKTLEDAISYGLKQVEDMGDFPDIVLTLNYLYPFRPKNLIDDLIDEIQCKGLDAVFVGYMDYQNIWMRSESNCFIQIGDGFKTRERKQPLYESHYGLGCVTTPGIIRTGKLVGGQVGILPIDERLYTIKIDQKSGLLVSAIYRYFNENENELIDMANP
jgi:rhamnosyltransferase